MNQGPPKMFTSLSPEAVNVTLDGKRDFAEIRSGGGCAKWAHPYERKAQRGGAGAVRVNAEIRVRHPPAKEPKDDKRSQERHAADPPTGAPEGTSPRTP